jgi:streptogramin lyase
MRAGFRAFGLAALLLLVFAVPQSSAMTPTLTEVDVGPTAGGGLGPNGITVGPDNGLWFSENLGHTIGRLVPGSAPTFPATLGSNENPLGITVGSDNNLWYAEHDLSGGNSQIGMYSPGADTHQTFGAVPLDNTRPEHIVSGPDGALWFDETNTVPPTVGRITPGVAVISQFNLGLPDPRVGTTGVAVGPDGNLWVGDPTGNQVWSLHTDGSVAGGPFPVGAGPRALVTGPDGYLWVAESGASKIGVLTTSGTLLHEYPVAHKPYEITVGPDGAIWFTANDDPPPLGAGGAAEVGRITTDGTLFEKPLATDSLPRSITAGPDGNMWFPFEQNNTVARITVPPSATTGAASNVTVSSATLSGTANDRSQPGTYHFDYGTTTSYGSSTTDTSLAASASNQSASSAVTGLQPSTLYHYRLVVVNGTDTTLGADQTFTTANQPAPSTTPTPSGGSGSSDVGPVIPPPPVEPPLLPENLDLRLRGRAIEINRAGRGLLRVSCAGGETCAVTGRLLGSVRARRGHGAARKRLGRVGGSAPPDRVGAVRVALNASGRRLVRRNKRVRANLEGTVRNASGSAAFRRVVVLTVSRVHHRR